MKYQIHEVTFKEEVTKHVTVLSNGGATTFEAQVGNPNYDTFLTQADLTDVQVQKLKTDTWYDFPKES